MIIKFISILLSFISLSNFLIAEIEYEIRDIGTLQTNSSEAVALNNNGNILGWYNVDGSKDGKRFFVRDPDGNFFDLPSKVSEVDAEINWQNITEDGRVYGTLNGIDNLTVLYLWDEKNGVVNLGNIPGKEIVINNNGQVLIKTVTQNQNGKSIKGPAIWSNGIITYLQGLEADIGIESEISYGFDINNKGEVVGQSEANLNYKNKIYKQVHAVKWVNGQPIDLHSTIPKTEISYASAINDLGDVLINQGIDTKINNIGYVYSKNFVKEKNGKSILDLNKINDKIQNDASIWIMIHKIISVNDMGEIIATGSTVYGEQHALLLIPKMLDPIPDETSFENNVEDINIIDSIYTSENITIILQDTIDAAHTFYTADIEQKVRLYFLDMAAKGDKLKGYVEKPYREILLLEAMDNIITEIDNLSKILGCEKQHFFWDIAQELLIKKVNSVCHPKINAYIKLRKLHIPK